MQTTTEEPKSADELIKSLNEKTTDTPAPSIDKIHEIQDLPDFDPPAPEPTPEEIAARQAKQEDISPAKAKSTAKTWVKWFSSLMAFAFPQFYKKTILAPGDEARMRAFVQQSKSQNLSERQMEDVIHSDHELAPVKTRFDKYLDACEKVKLSEEEIDYIAEPLSELIKKYKYLQLSPEWSLVLAVTVVMLPRFEPMMPDLSKIFAAADQKTK